MTGIEFRLLAFVLISHWLVYLVAFQPFALPMLWKTWAVAALGFATLMVLRLTAAQWLSGRLLRAADLLVFYLCVLAVGGELMAKTTAKMRPSVLLFHPDVGAERRVEAQRRPPGYIRFGMPVNSQGFYDHELAAERQGPLVAVVGDSFSQGVVPHYYHYTTVAERKTPGVEIYNAGIAGVDPREYLHLLLHDVLPLDPDIVVIALFVGNDLTFSLPPAGPSLLADWYSAERSLLIQIPRRLAALRAAAVNEVHHDVSVLGGDSEAGIIEQTPAALGAVFPWVLDPLQERPTFLRRTFLEIQTKRARDLSLQDDDSYQRRFSVLRRIADACGRTPVLFLVIPDENQVDDALWSEVQSRTEMHLQRDRPQRLLFEWFKEQGLTFIDPLPSLRSAMPLEDGHPHVFHLQDTHLNARGNRIVGEALVEGLRPVMDQLKGR